MISVIIPTYNEAENLPILLRGLMEGLITPEIIVVDGGSTDNTIDIIKNHGIRVINSESGRGKQLHAGAMQATGEVLLFIHADSRLSQEALLRIEEVLRNPFLLGGNFRIVFEGDRPFCRFMNWFYAIIRKYGLYYGDSGLFVRRSAYEKLGGFRPLPIMEDYDFIRCLERLGKTICIKNPPIVTSSRRFEGKHPFQMFWLWGKMHLLFALGASNRQLERHYYGEQPHEI